MDDLEKFAKIELEHYERLAELDGPPEPGSHREKAHKRAAATVRLMSESAAVGRERAELQKEREEVRRLQYELGLLSEKQMSEARELQEAERRRRAQQIRAHRERVLSELRNPSCTLDDDDASFIKALASEDPMALIGMARDKLGHYFHGFQPWVPPEIDARAIHVARACLMALVAPETEVRTS